MSERAVLLAGMLCDAGLWARVESELDIPAVHPELSEPSITGMAERVLSTTDGPLLLVGLSLGAIVGFEIARIAPERIAGFAALSTNASAPRTEQRHQWQRMARRCDAGEFHAVTEEVLTTMYADPSPRPELAEDFLGMARRTGRGRFRAQLAAQASRTDARAVLPSITAPALVACGEADALCPPDFHRAIADRLPDAELHVVPEAGHLLPLEAPRSTATLLNRLIRRLRRQPSPKETDHARSTETPGAATESRP